MKNKILILIIGILIGAIITTTAFLIYNRILEENPKEQGTMKMDENGKMQIPSKGNMGEPPERLNENRGTTSETSTSSSKNNI